MNDPNREDAATYVLATGQGGAEVTENHAGTLNCNHEAPVLAFKIRGGSETDTGSQGSKTVGRAAGKGFLGSEDKAFTIGATQDQFLSASMAVRRLTPRECERLQGFPDDYTAIPGAADGPRYKALGNSMAVPVMAWIGHRIDEAMRCATK